MTKLYVGNLPFTATEDSVRALFAPHGTVEKVALITDRDTGRPRGFGFIEMSNADASKAMQALNGQDFDGRALKINEAHDRDRAGGGGWRWRWQPRTGRRRRRRPALLRRSKVSPGRSPAGTHLLFRRVSARRA